jgi:hypothetical protein
MKTLLDYLKELGAVKASVVSGPNGKFISYVLANDTKATLPIGKNSYAGTLSTFNILIATNGQAIATVNSYEEVESMDL